MIYNLRQWLENQFPAETIFADERREIAGAVVPDRCVLLREMGGAETAPMKTGFAMVQVLARDKTVPDARALAWSIYDYMDSRWGQILTAVTVGSVAHPAVQTGQISAVSRPQCLGEDAEGRTEFSTNFKVYWRRT